MAGFATDHVVGEDEWRPLGPRSLMAEPAGEEAVAERLEDEVLGGAVVAGLDQDVVELGQERVLQLDAGLLLKRLEGFWMIGASILKFGLRKLGIGLIKSVFFFRGQKIANC